MIRGPPDSISVTCSVSCDFRVPVSHTFGFHLVSRHRALAPAVRIIDWLTRSLSADSSVTTFSDFLFKKKNFFSIIFFQFFLLFSKDGAEYANEVMNKLVADYSAAGYLSNASRDETSNFLPMKFAQIF